MIEKILPVKSSWTKTAANYVFDMDENDKKLQDRKHLHEKTWSDMAFDGENTHEMEDKKLTDLEKTKAYAGRDGGGFGKDLKKTGHGGGGDKSNALVKLIRAHKTRISERAYGGKNERMAARMMPKSKVETKE